ncbi:MAG: YchF/TatD family DNA exonuclease [Propionibacteriales bacterium]|nr:YchF/TatD family DNA exonuclease [Propionibacteriales bacterium]
MIRPEVPDPLPHPVADSHCHLDIEDGPDGTPLEVGEALTLAESVGVRRIVHVGCDLPGARWAVDVAAQYPQVVAAVALHPNEAPVLSDAGGLDDALAEIDRLAGDNPRVRAVGETGLDYYRTEAPGRPAQHASFRVHIAIAKRHGKTLVIHDRDAHADVLRILDAEGPPERVVMHCFSGDREFARQCVERGFWLSFAGTVTFKNAAYLRDAMTVTPLDRLLVETDAPYLTPMPWRGRRNASYLVPLTVRTMADTKGVDLDTLCRAIDHNTSVAFGGGW